MTAEPIGDAALAEVVRLAEGATEGPWRVQPERRDEWEVPFEPVTDSGGNVIAHAYDCHAAFIAAANPATVLAMGARITAAEATLAKVQRSAGRVSREAVERVARGICERESIRQFGLHYPGQAIIPESVRAVVEMFWQQHVPDARAAIRDLELEMEGDDA